MGLRPAHSDLKSEWRCKETDLMSGFGQVSLKYLIGIVHYHQIGYLGYLFEFFKTGRFVCTFTLFYIFV